MKLSELLLKPIKLKGKGFLNLKGFSKQVVDTEVGDSKKYYSTLNELVSDVYKQRFLFVADNIDINRMVGDTEEGDVANVGDIGVVRFFDSEEGYNGLFSVKITDKSYNQQDEDYFYQFTILKILGSYQQKLMFYLE